MIKGLIKKLLSFFVRPIRVEAIISYLQPNGRLLGKRIIVTGGSRGIGYAMAHKFTQEGASVLITGRNENSLRRSASEIGCKYLVLDIQDVSLFESFINEAEKKLSGIDCLVNNAGISLHESSFFDVTPESFDLQIGTNLRGPFFLTQTYVNYLRRKKQAGNVLFVSSETGFTMDIRPYGYTKAAINSMVQGLAYALAKGGIRINAVAPGITATEMTGFGLDGNLYCGNNMTKRAYLPEEVAETACFLLSDASGCISGQVIACNNGRSINARVKNI
jgi:NAD(P)-dependent dehydrogenase (short-subunit alcohol dehydrogenase family)